jgi:hypothetical protein
MPKWKPGPFLPITPERISRIPKWARDLRDQNWALIKVVAELKSENRRFRRRLGTE